MSEYDLPGHDPARHDPARHDPAKHDPARHDPARHDLATRRTVLTAAVTTAAVPLTGFPDGRAPAAASTEAVGREALAGTAVGAEEAATQIVVLPDDGRTPLLEFIASAAQRLDLYVFDLREDGIEQALSDAVRRGVVVRALVESNPSGRATSAWSTLSRLRRAGVQARTASPVFGKTHAKALLVDSARAWIGSGNLTDTWRSARDYAVIAARPATVNTLAEIFEADWELAGHSWLGALRRTAQRRRPEPASALVVSPANGRAAVLELIRSATRRLYIEHSRLDDAQIVAALAERSRAGVAVNAVLGEDAVNSRTRRVLRKQAPKVNVRLVSDPTIHAKVVVADEARMLLGSHNLTRESLDARREIGVVVADSVAVSRVTETLRRDLDRGRGGRD